MRVYGERDTARRAPEPQRPTAVLLAAGRGRRLGSRGENLPKGAIELGGESLTARTLRLLGDLGVNHCVIVTGHEAEWYRNLSSSRARLSFVHNDRFLTTGSLWSLALAAAHVEDDALVIESDLVYERAALRALLDAGRTDAVLMSRATGSGDEVFVAEHEGRLVALSKDPDQLGQECAGEFVGISRMTQSMLARLRTAAEAQGGDVLEYEQGLASLAGSTPVEVLSVPDLVWAEIDTERDLDRVKREVWPRIGPDIIERGRR
jgi:choline kinase